MKKSVLALLTIAALTGSASAADLAPRPYAKAPPIMAAPVYNWTGFYLFGGAGYGMYTADSHDETYPGTPVAITINQRSGGHGWFGTVGGGYDWQFAGSWVAGIFADAQFGEIRGTHQGLISSGNVPIAPTGLSVPALVIS